MSHENAQKQRERYYRMKEEGAYSGSPRQITWDHSRKMHECCESKKSLYHKASCPNRGKYIELRNEAAPVDANLKERVQELKAQGLCSGDVLNVLLEEGVETTLAKVNKVYA